MKLNRNKLLTAFVVVMVLASLPGAVQETLETGRVYLFSRQFLDDLPRRFTGPGRFRFILQPVLAIVFGVYGGLADAKGGQSPYIFALLFHAQKRKQLLRSGMAAVGPLMAMGILLDAVAQLLIYRRIHPGAALLIGPVLICIPYACSRGLTARIARRLKQQSSTPAIPK